MIIVDVFPMVGDVVLVILKSVISDEDTLNVPFV